MQVCQYYTYTLISWLTFRLLFSSAMCEEYEATEKVLKLYPLLSAMKCSVDSLKDYIIYHIRAMSSQCIYTQTQCSLAPGTN